MAGSDPENPQGDTEAFSENEQWEEIFIEDQPLLENHAACWHDRCLYIFGGQFAQHGTMVMWKEGTLDLHVLSESRLQKVF